MNEDLNIEDFTHNISNALDSEPFLLTFEETRGGKKNNRKRYTKKENSNKYTKKKNKRRGGKKIQHNTSKKRGKKYTRKNRI